MECGEVGDYSHLQPHAISWTCTDHARAIYCYIFHLQTVGWRDDARHIVIYLTDAGYHFAYDGLVVYGSCIVRVHIIIFSRPFSGSSRVWFDPMMVNAILRRKILLSTTLYTTIM